MYTHRSMKEGLYIILLTIFIFIYTQNITYALKYKGSVIFTVHKWKRRNIINPEKQQFPIKKMRLLTFTPIYNIHIRGLKYIWNLFYNSLLDKCDIEHIYSCKSTSIVTQFQQQMRAISFYYRECAQSSLITAQYHSFSAPCKQIHFSSIHPVTLELFITVQTALSINITVLEAYVPYSENCYQHYISIIDASQINTFCGYVKEEIIYTFYPQGTITMEASKTFLAHNIRLHMVYEAHLRGLAYRFSEFYFLPTWNVSITHSPSFVLFSEDRLKYVWYLHNEVTRSKSLITVNTTLVTIQFYSCSNNDSALAVYAGLLNWNLIKWRAKPIKKLFCTFLKLDSVAMTFHWYATAILDTSSLEADLGLNIVFSISPVDIESSLKEEIVNDMLHIKHDRTMHDLPYITHSTYQHVVHMSTDYFHYTGENFNV